MRVCARLWGWAHTSWQIRVGLISIIQLLIVWLLQGVEKMGRYKNQRDWDCSNSYENNQIFTPLKWLHIRTNKVWLKGDWPQICNATWGNTPTHTDTCTHTQTDLRICNTPISEGADGCSFWWGCVKAWWQRLSQLHTPHPTLTPLSESFHTGQVSSS